MKSMTWDDDGIREKNLRTSREACFESNLRYISLCLITRRHDERGQTETSLGNFSFSLKFYNLPPMMIIIIIHLKFRK